MRVKLICATTTDGYIARHSTETTTWTKDLPLFKQQTMNKTVIMGSNTYNTLESELSGRNVVVVTRKDNPKTIIQNIAKKESEIFVQDQNIIALGDQIKALLVELRIVAKALETYEGVEITSLETKDTSDKIKSFGKQLSMHIAASNPISLDKDGIVKDILKKEEELVSEELKNTGKPVEIVKKISLGKMNKFKEDNSLLNQAWVMEPKKKVNDIIKELKISDLKIRDFFRIKIGE